MKVTKLPLQCKNCQSELSPDAKFCSQCGQNTRDYHQSFPRFLSDGLHELLDIDGRLWLTIKTLLLKPGLASLEFDQGKRTKYTPPLRLYLVISVLFFLAFSSFQHVYSGESMGADSAADKYSRAMFVLFPLFAFYVKCFYWNSFYISNLVLSMHLHSIGYLALLLIGPFESIESRHTLFITLQAIPLFYLVWYFFNAFKTMYAQSWPVTILKTSAIYFIYMATFGVVFDVVLT